MRPDARFIIRLLPIALVIGIGVGVFQWLGWI